MGTQEQVFTEQLRLLPGVPFDYFKARVESIPYIVNHIQAGECLWHGLFSERQRRSLGGNFREAYENCGGTLALLCQARGTSRDRSILDAAWHLNLINRSDYLRIDAMIRRNEPANQVRVEGPNLDNCVPIEDQIEEARAHRNLVVCQGVGTRIVYWRGEVIEADWKRKNTEWNFLQALIEAVKKRAGVDCWTMKTSGSSMTTTRNRLKLLLPPDLNALISSTPPSTYSLNVLPAEIVIFQLGMDDHPYDISNLENELSALTAKKEPEE